MQKKFTAILLMIIVLLSVVGCGKEDLGDSYIQGSDYQYMFKSLFYNTKARGEDGYFFLQGHYIYYLDDKTQQLVPLCNKADCLHNAETDESRYEECNAYVNNSLLGGEVGIAYCNGYLYFIEEESDAEGDFQTLYRIKEDGSQKEKVHKWDNAPVEQWCIHRDVLYFVEHTYTTEKTETAVQKAIEKYAVKQLNLKGFGKKKAETIYETEAGITVYSVSNLEAYGNYVYFAVHGATTEDTSGITDDNYLDYFYFKHMVCQIQTGDVEELKVPDQEPGVMVENVTFWQNRILMSVYDTRKELNDTTTSYIADLDGSNVEIFKENEVQGKKYFSDGKYLYISNSPLVIRGVEEKQTYEVYDSEGNLVDVFGMPFQTGGDPEIGMEDGLYLFMGSDENEAGATLCYFDKSTIGSYQGEPYSCTEIVEWNYAPADQME